jgi:hypothetical protein
MVWEEGQSYTCPHCGRECVIFRGGPNDLVTRKRHTCEQYKKFKKTQPKQSLSETFAIHSEGGGGGKRVEVPYAGSGHWITKKWRDEFQKYMTDEVYQCNKNMSLFLAKYQRPMSEYFIPYDKGQTDYTLGSKKERMSSGW